MKPAFVFPGQGAQYAGMGRALAEAFSAARDAFAEADEALGFALSSLCFEGPEDRLRLTYYTQPAILATSAAAWRAFASAGGAVAPAFVAGHSLGEYTALVAAGSLAYADALRLVHLRGRLMDEAVPAGRGAMAAVLGAERDALAELCERVSADAGEPVELANVNCPGQLVVSGAAAAVQALATRAAEAGARRALRLDVSGPFHSSLMRPAGARLAAELAKTAVRGARVPVVANVHARPLLAADDIREALAQQVASPVLWEASVTAMAAGGVTDFVEFGPGTVLSGLIRKTAGQVRTWHVEDPETLSQALAGLAGGER